MKYKVLLLLLLGLTTIQAAPARVMPACLLQDCDYDSGPVCGIDATGMPRTFENRCMAMVSYCTHGSFYVEVKPGEC